MAETGCDAVKLEGGAEMADRIAGIARAGIPVIGHLGLTPQSVSALGGFRLQGKGAAQAKKIVDDAKALEEAGAFCILLELVPDRVCELITERAKHCIIMSLGSGPDAHGQLLIYHDAFGLYPKFKPRMAKVFADAGAVIRRASRPTCTRSPSGPSPQPENWFGMKDEEYDELDATCSRRHRDDDRASAAADLRDRLAIPTDRLDDLNALLLDPETRVVNDLLAVVRALRHARGDQPPGARGRASCPSCSSDVRADAPAVPGRPRVARRAARPGRLRQRRGLPPQGARRRRRRDDASATIWPSRSRSAPSSTSPGSSPRPAGRSTSARSCRGAGSASAR